MAKFCANCGNQMMDNAVVCPACGAPAEAQAAPAAEKSPAAAIKKLDPKVLKLGGIAVAAVAVIAIIIAIIVGAGGNYKKALNNYFDYTFKTNVKKVESLAPKKYWEYCKESGLIDVNDKDEVNECNEEYLEKLKEELEEEYGEKIKYSYKVTKEKDLSTKKLNDIAETLKEKYNIPKKSIKAAKEIDIDYKLSGKDDTEEDEWDSIIVVKIDSKWYVYEADGTFGDYTGEYDWEAHAEYIKEKEDDKKEEDEE